MATYKLIQDIEAEDHILGPLTLNQFLYGLGAAFFYYLSFIVVAKNLLILLIIFLPPALFATFFAFPFKRDQPTEVWALAKLRYYLKPKVRIWSQSGIKDLVKITAPKKNEQPRTNGLSETEVKSRLEALAMTIDSRGWVVKNMATLPLEPNTYRPNNTSDRLIDIGSIPTPVPDYDVTPYDDMLEDNSPLSQQVTTRLEESSAQHRNDLLKSLNGLSADDKNKQEWLGGDSESDISHQLKNHVSKANLSTQNMHSVPIVPVITKPKAALQQKPKVTKPKPTPPQEKPINPAILNLSKSNDRNISSLAHEANEIVVNLR